MSTLNALNDENLTSLETTRSANAACRLVLLYADSEAYEQAGRLLFKLRHTVGPDIPLQALWWKFSVLRDPSMAQLALDDAAHADILLYAFGSNNDAPNEILNFNRQWVHVRNHHHGLLAIQLALSDSIAEATQRRFARLAKSAGLDFISAEDNELNFCAAADGNADIRRNHPVVARHRIDAFVPQYAAA
jgi:hypothetical protein